MPKFLKILMRVLPKPRGNNVIRVKRAFMYFCRLFPIDRKKVVFSSYFSTRCDDSPRAIFKEMVKEHPDWKFVWLMMDSNTKIKHAITVINGSYEAIYHLATAKLWIDNCRKEYWLVKRKKQFYVQTWHGNVAIKKVEKDAEQNLSDEYIRNAKADSKMADLFISGTKWRTQNYKNAFWYNGEILEVGYPYSDVLYGNKKEFHNKICKVYSLSKETRFCLYAPTYRRDGSLKSYNMNYEQVLNALKLRWGGDWKLLLRLHPNIRQKHNELHYTKDVIDASEYTEMAELAVGVDFIISDYSSTLIDAVEAKVYGLIYASDYEEYNKDRSLYFEKEELPYEFCETNEQLINEILNYDEIKSMNRIEDFYNKMGFFNDAHSTKRVVNAILTRIQGV